MELWLGGSGPNGPTPLPGFGDSAPVPVGRGPGASWPGFERLAGARKHKFTPIPAGKLRELFPAASMYSDKSSLTEMGFGRGVPGDVGEEGGDSPPSPPTVVRVHSSLRDKIEV